MKKDRIFIFIEEEFLKESGLKELSFVENDIDSHSEKSFFFENQSASCKNFLREEEKRV